MDTKDAGVPFGSDPEEKQKQTKYKLQWKLKLELQSKPKLKLEPQSKRQSEPLSTRDSDSREGEEAVTLGGQHRPMERPSEASQSPGSTWKGLLIITASIFSCWIQPTSADDFNIIPNPSYGTVGLNITLNIQGPSSPASTNFLIKAWRIQMSRNNKELTIRNVNRNDKGPFVCEIGIPLNVSNPYILNIAYGPDPPTIVPTSDHYKVVGEHIKLICSAVSNPPAQFTWIHKGKTLSNSATFSATASLNHAGTYTCQAFNSITRLRRTKDKTLTIYGPLSKPTIISSNMAPVENKDNFSLTCQATGVVVTYRWFIDQRAPSGDRIRLSRDNRTLTIRSMPREDKRPFVCEIVNPISRNRSDPFIVNVTYGPDTAMIAPAADHYNVGERIQLSCSAVSNPPAQFTWIHKGKTLSNSATFSATASVNHAGTYTCQAFNSISRLRRTKDKTLTIYGPLSKPTISSSKMAPVENKDTVSLTCQATGVIVTYQWFKNLRAPSGDRIQLSWDNRTLIINNITREDKGPYVCEVRNPFTSNRNDPYTLNVAYGPETPTIIPTIDEYNEGERMELICSAESNPPAQFTWIHNGKVLRNSATFSATASLNHAGTYACQAFNSITGLKRTKDKTLIIYALLSIPIINSSNMAPVENKDNISLTCQATDINLTYRWFINQRALVGHRIQMSPDNRTLIINTITRKDKGPYVCEIENPAGRRKSDSFTLNVTYGPDTPTILPTINQYHVGANINLACSAESNPPAQFTWFHNQKKVSKSATFSATASLDHAGTYTCYASNSYTGLNSTKKKYLTISEDKNFTIYAGFTIYENLMEPNKNIYNSNFIIENGTAVLTCDTDNGFLPGIRWYFQNKKLILNERKTLSDHGQTFTIKPVKREDMGAYQCEIWNPFLANISDLFNLTVVYGPEQITILPHSVNGQIEVIFKENLTLECRASSLPPAQYAWQVNGSSISGNSGNNYTISQASWEDSGTYRCMAMNNAANATISTSITVRVIDKKALSGWAIAGFVIGVLAGVALIGCLLFCCLLLRECAGQKSSSPEEKDPRPVEQGKQPPQRQRQALGQPHSLQPGDQQGQLQGEPLRGDALLGGRAEIPGKERGGDTRWAAQTYGEALRSLPESGQHLEGAPDHHSCWIQPTSAQAFNVAPDPAYGRVGGNVTLNIQGYNGSTLSYTWHYKSSAENPKDTQIAVYYPGKEKKQTPDNIRQRVLQNGSLLIPDLSLNDAGYYTPGSGKKPQHDPLPQEVCEELRLPELRASCLAATESPGELRGPWLQRNHDLEVTGQGHVPEADGRILRSETMTWSILSSLHQYPQQGMEWYINQEASAENNNKILTIFNVTRKDTGPYECEIKTVSGSIKSDPLTLNVIYGPDTPTIYPKEDDVRIGSTVSLTYSAESNPSAHYK
ncbi:hemicentin-1-like [Gracilinanus agilis]|uniref:hemicentin-1-like n=1 Tax=Gracilinanus agilis TaxID=191870 RepID=UPI001CFCB650|nr:hemicentin-1-like [Gracilinanus agilis]